MDMGCVAGQEHPAGSEAIDHPAADPKLRQPCRVAQLCGVVADALGQQPPHQVERDLGGARVDLRAALDEQPPAPLAGHSLVSDDVAGAWVSVAMLAGLEAGRDAAGELPELATRWRGDRLWIYESAEASLATLWAIEWADADSAARFGALGAELSPEGAALRIDTTGASTRITAVERSENLEAWRAALAEVAP